MSTVTTIAPAPTYGVSDWLKGLTQMIAPTVPVSESPYDTAGKRAPPAAAVSNRTIGTFTMPKPDPIAISTVPLSDFTPNMLLMPEKKTPYFLYIGVALISAYAIYRVTKKPKV